MGGRHSMVHRYRSLSGTPSSKHHILTRIVILSSLRHFPLSGLSSLSPIYLLYSWCTFWTINSTAMMKMLSWPRSRVMIKIKAELTATLKVHDPRRYSPDVTFMALSCLRAHLSQHDITFKRNISNSQKIKKHFIFIIVSGKTLKEFAFSAQSKTH